MMQRPREGGSERKIGGGAERMADARMVNARSPQGRRVEGGGGRAGE
jgi:hypothetical protein